MHIAILDGHPDPKPERLCHALAAAYAAGARQAGHEVRMIDLAAMDVPMLRSQQEWLHGALPAQFKEAQETLKWTDHLVIIYPLWLGDVPAYLKAFLEQVARPGFAFTPGSRSLTPLALKGKSAHVIVTMGMPGLVYRWFFFKHSLTSLKRNVLEFAGIRPVRETLIGNVEATDHAKWLERMRAFGRAAR